MTDQRIPPGEVYDTNSAGRTVLVIDALDLDADLEADRAAIYINAYNIVPESGPKYVGGFEVSIYGAGEENDPEYEFMLTPAAARQIAHEILHRRGRKQDHNLEMAIRTDERARIAAIAEKFVAESPYSDEFQAGFRAACWVILKETERPQGMTP